MNSNDFVNLVNTTAKDYAKSMIKSTLLGLVLGAVIVVVADRIVINLTKESSEEEQIIKNED